VRLGEAAQAIDAIQQKKQTSRNIFFICETLGRNYFLG
jgi:hypothetical protein